MTDWYGVRCLDQVCLEPFGYHPVEGYLCGLPTFGLQQAKLGRVLADGAVESLLGEADEQEGIGMVQEGTGVGECDLAIALKAGSDAAGGFGEETVFKGDGAVKTPEVIGYGLGEAEFGGVGGRELVDELATEGFVSGGILVWQQGEPASQAVLHRVAADGLATGGSARSAGLFGIAAVGGELLP
jgi:hypothetical protein